MKHIFQFLILLFIAAACKEVFDRPPQSLVQVGLYGIDTQTALSTLVSIHGLNQDSVWIDGESLSVFQLPLDQSGQAIFVLLMDSVADTITINYSSELAYESMESGFYTTHNIQSFSNTWNKIDSVSVTDTVVISTWHENIQLYLNDSTAVTSAN